MLIKGKIHLQKEVKELNKLLEQYEDNIIKIENKLNTYRRKNVVRPIKQSRNIRTGRNKAKNPDGDVI
jgi:prefoldin subunit 5